MAIPLWDAFFAKIKADDRLHLAWCISGVIGCLVAYERIMQEPFGGEAFSYSLFLVLCNRILTCSVALSMLLLHGQDLRPVAPIYSYAAVSVSNTVATFCQYEALKHVSFPVQTLGKCAKMIPVMLWGTVIMRKRYGAKDYLSAGLVTLGCTLFLMTGAVKSRRAAADSSTLGVGLMLGYLGFDGFTSTFQDKLFKAGGDGGLIIAPGAVEASVGGQLRAAGRGGGRRTGPGLGGAGPGFQMTIHNQILYVTVCSAAFSALGLVARGQLLPALAFLAAHPEALRSILALSAASTCGQLFISHTIKSYGALIFATVMTTRQFLSILLSCLLFRHPLTPGQWVGTAMVFGTLYHKGFSRGPPKPKADAPAAAAAAAAETEPLTAGEPAARPAAGANA
eukprot:scaffold20.g7813.t1